jgi:hypothetical protein
MKMGYPRLEPVGSTNFRTRTRLIKLFWIWTRTVFLIFLMKYSNPTLIVASKIRDIFFPFLYSASSRLYILLKRINEEKLKENVEQSKRRLSTSDDEQSLVFKNRDSLISSTTTKNK